MGKSSSPHHDSALAEKAAGEIVDIRGFPVIPDYVLAELYGVETRRLNEQVTRNEDRFPEDFAFRLTKKEFAHLKSQNATSSREWGGRRKEPRVFTEHGALAAAGILNSERATKMNIHLVREFVRLRRNEKERSLLALAGQDSRKLPDQPPASDPSDFRKRAFDFLKTLNQQMGQAVGGVLNQSIGTGTGTTIREEMTSLVSTAYDSLKARLEKPRLEDDELISRITGSTVPLKITQPWQ